MGNKEAVGTQLRKQRRVIVTTGPPPALLPARSGDAVPVVCAVPPGHWLRRLRPVLQHAQGGSEGTLGVGGLGCGQGSAPFPCLACGRCRGKLQGPTRVVSTMLLLPLSPPSPPSPANPPPYHSLTPPCSHGTRGCSTRWSGRSTPSVSFLCEPWAVLDGWVGECCSRARKQGCHGGAPCRAWALAGLLATLQRAESRAAVARFPGLCPQNLVPVPPCRCPQLYLNYKLKSVAHLPWCGGKHAWLCLTRWCLRPWLVSQWHRLPRCWLPQHPSPVFCRPAAPAGAR